MMIHTISPRNGNFVLNAMFLFIFHKNQEIHFLRNSKQVSFKLPKINGPKK